MIELGRHAHFSMLGVVLAVLGGEHLVDAVASIPVGARLYIRDNRQENWGVARSWNWGIRTALADGCTYVLVMPEDVAFESHAVDELRQALRLPSVILSSGNVNVDTEGDNSGWDHPDFSLFMVDERLFRIVGTFDEAYFPAYFEDNDMHEQIMRAGWRTYCPQGATFRHWRSQSIRQFPHISALSGQHFAKNHAYFVAKWGHEPA